MKRFHILSASIVAAVTLLTAGLTAWLIWRDASRCEQIIGADSSRHELFIARLLLRARGPDKGRQATLSSLLNNLPAQGRPPLLYAGHVGPDGLVRDLWLRPDAKRFLSGNLPKDPAKALASLSQEKKTASKISRVNVSLPDDSKLKLGFDAPGSTQMHFWPAVVVALLGLTAALVVGFMVRPSQNTAVVDLLAKALKEAKPRLMEEPMAVEELARRTGDLCRTQAKSIAHLQGYLAGPLFDRVSTGRPLGGEERAVAVMRIRLHNITELQANEPSDKVLTVANTYLDAIIEVLVHRGAVIGAIDLEGLDAWWGSPDDIPEPEALACKAAVEIRRGVFELERRQKTIGHPVAHMSIGIASGRCLLARLGSTRQMRPVLVGQAARDARRLASMAGPEEILVTQGTAVLVEEAGLRLESLSSPDQDSTVWRLLSEKK